MFYFKRYEKINFTWNQYNYIETAPCGNATGNFYKHELGGQGRYKINFRYYQDKDCKLEKNIKTEFTIP